jgi:hypothetical protein
MRYPLHLSAPVVILLWICASFAPLSRAQAPSHSAETEGGASQSSAAAMTTVPGPLHSFMRMAAISQKVAPDEVMPLLARNVFLTGYQGSGSRAQATEFLLLLRRYVQQARELVSLAGPDGVIRVSGCSDSKQLLDVLGYRTRFDCGKAATFVETADPQRAFLTTDSGFPLPDLEKTLQGGAPFVYPYRNSQVPIYLTEREWVEASEEAAKSKSSQDLVDVILHDPSLARLYYSWAPLDPETQAALERSPGLKRLVPLAASIDFYGSYIRVRSGRVLVPGGSEAESEWAELAGAKPESPGEFIPRLLSKDDGWLAAYFDSLSRIPPVQQAHFVQSPRLQRSYEALRGKGAAASAVSSVFRPDPNLLLLMTRLRWESNGDPHVPGNPQVWRRILGYRTYADMARSWGLRVKASNNPEGLLEDIFALSRVRVEGGPAEAFLVMSEIDGRRPAGRRLSPQTVEVMANKFPEFSTQYLLFCEFPQLSDGSITLFLKTAEALEKISDHTLRGNAMGIFEANVGIWQILARQGEIPASSQDGSWQAMVEPFAHIGSSTQLFDAGHKSLAVIVAVSEGSAQRPSQDGLVGLLAGPAQTTPEGQRIHRELADRIRAVLDDQRLVSLDTLLALGNGLIALEQGSGKPDKLIPLADELTEFQMPRPIFTKSERTEFTGGAYNNRHTDLEMRTDLTKVLKSPASKDQLEAARGELVPFLRDTLVGFNYAYYEPPGAQAVHNNPLLVRSHDFSGETVMGMEESLWQTPRLFGAGSPAGGGAHLVGSLADLPYVLAQMEEDFISPENVQALIWSDLVPAVLTDAVLPRWWGVSRNELHAIALYQRAGEELVAASEGNEELRGKVVGILSDRMTPHRASEVNDALQGSQAAELSRQITPADKFYLASEFRRRYPGESASFGAAGKELDDLSKQDPIELSWERISEDFGVPHPVLARTYSRELLNITPFPMFEGYSSRLLAETWDSTNLYWARLADEMGYPPETLNRLAPELTVRMVAKIFATDLNDWPAILRAMREAGDEFRQGKVASLSTNGVTPQP